jgi:UDP-N-acetylmuramoyl-tripeptide--D-alanyl-D-alanine ligase
MGSYGPGDIAYLCRIAPPRVGIMTAVGPAHLERFGSVEAIARTDYELIEALPGGTGVAIFNGDDEWCRRLAVETHDRRVVQTGLGPAPGLDLWASDVVTTPTGSRFMVHAAAGNAAAFKVELLGRHNVSNMLMAAAAALACGMTLQEVARAAERAQAAAHRLQLVRGAGGVTIIDDSYNANPEGVAAALAVLGEMQGRRKVLVTAGIFELGAREAEEHRKLGRLAARVCDAAILIGPRRTQPILEELRDSGFPADHAFVVRTLAEARAQLARLLGPGDVVLFGADPPGHYVE